MNDTSVIAQALWGEAQFLFRFRSLLCFAELPVIIVLFCIGSLCLASLGPHSFCLHASSFHYASVSFVLWVSLSECSSCLMGIVRVVCCVLFWIE